MFLVWEPLGHKCLYFLVQWWQLSIAEGRYCVIIPSPLQLMKGLLLFTLVVALLLVGGYVSVKLWGKKYYLPFCYLCIFVLLHNSLFLIQGNSIIVLHCSQVLTCLSAWLVRGCGNDFLTGKPWIPWLFFLVRCLMGYLLVGRHGLENRRGFGLPWFTIFSWC